MKECDLIVDLGYGSSGKGLVAGYLAEKHKPDTVITAWGPNSGHTYINADGRKWTHTMLANGIVSPNLKRVLIGPGSVINFEALLEEIRGSIDLLDGVKFYIHPNACFVSESDRKMEAVKMLHLGSTMKGTGSVAMRRIARNPNDDPRVCSPDVPQYLEDIRDLVEVSTSSEEYLNALENTEVCLIEGAQGFSLSVFHGFWPYTTSRDCTPAQICADTGVSIRDVTNIVGCVRTYPIRVANRYDENGKQVGWSGPCYDDQRELEWKDLGMEPELTTVTQLPRRVFTFSEKQLKEAVQVCRPDEIFLNFCNYLAEDEQEDFISMVDKISEVGYLGFGPTVDDIHPIEYL